MKTFKHLIPLMFLVLIALVFRGASAERPLDNTGLSAEEKEAGFSDCRVLVVFDRETSLQFKSYSADDFPEIGCVEILDLTADEEQMYIDLIASDEFDGNYDNIAFNKILCLKLKNPGIDNVLEAISKLKGREGILAAEPDIIISLNNEPEILSILS